MMTARKLHFYLGTLIAPSVLFFALSGALQLFDLHEAHGSYQPPAIFVQLGNLHKDQVLTKPTRSGGAAANSGSGNKLPTDAAASQAPAETLAISELALKCFFALVALGLTVSTGLGLWVALGRYRRNPVGWLLLAAGATFPVMLFFL
jgi:hypothetical protein